MKLHVLLLFLVLLLLGLGLVARAARILVAIAGAARILIPLRRLGELDRLGRRQKRGIARCCRAECVSRQRHDNETGRSKEQIPNGLHRGTSWGWRSQKPLRHAQTVFPPK